MSWSRWRRIFGQWVVIKFFKVEHVDFVPGILSNGAVIALIAAGGGYTVSGLNVRGAELLTSTTLWVLAFLAVSLYEEVYFRGYPLFTLATGLGFWPAAVLLIASLAGSSRARSVRAAGARAGAMKPSSLT